MWIVGLNELKKLWLYLYIQFNVGLLWSSIDMNYMNMYQSVYGDCEFGFIGMCMCKECKVVVGYWQDLKIVK